MAEARLAAAQKEHRQLKGKQIDPANAKMTFGQAAELYMRSREESVGPKKRTRTYWREVDVAVLKSWPGLADLELRRITSTACREWSNHYARIYSATRYNSALSHLRHVFELGIENGVLFASPAIGLKRRPQKGKELELPTRVQFAAFIAEMRNGRSRDSRNCADLAEGLAFTGCRISEARCIAWRDVDFTTGEILVRGDPEEATKNGEMRRVPLIPSARQLFERMRQHRSGEAATESVFAVRECQNAMNRAAKKIGMSRITHHDLRHFFATVCIESGVDIPTVSRWLGHKDGGALAMRTYGHLRREHSVSEAQKVSFAPVAAS